jgi:hypothetical protein
MLTILHACHKLSYFEKAGWKAEWIATACQITGEEFSRSYLAKADDEHGIMAGDVETIKVSRIYYFFTISTRASSPIQIGGNICDNLPALIAPKLTNLLDELDHYLAADPEYAENVLRWWYERRAMYLHLSRMARDYLSIPGMSTCSHTVIYTNLCLATSVDVEHVFSHGWLILSHVRSRLSAQSTCVILCLVSWTLLSLIKDDVRAVAALQEEEGTESDCEMDAGWDHIADILE